MTKSLIIIILTALTRTSFADGVDKVHVYLNNKLIKTVTESNHDSVTVDFHLGDTLKFFSWTDWGGQFNASMGIKNDKGIIISKIDRLDDRQYGAKFYYILDANSLNKKLTFILDYHSTQLKPWAFVTIALKHNKIPKLTVRTEHTDRIFGDTSQFGQNKVYRRSEIDSLPYVKGFNPCDKIIKEPDTVATYKKGFKDILDFFSKNINPIIDSCHINEDRMISNLHMILVIDKKGKVISAHVTRPGLPPSCRNLIQNGFLQMDAWKPAIHKGLNVCSDVKIPIHINWK